MLGYKDSGMPETPANEDPACFGGRRLDEAVGRLVAIIRRTSPQVILTYGDDQQGYPHPDHLRVHDISHGGLRPRRRPDRYRPRPARRGSREGVLLGLVAGRAWSPCTRSSSSSASSRRSTRSGSTGRARTTASRPASTSPTTSTCAATRCWPTPRRSTRTPVLVRPAARGVPHRAPHRGLRAGQEPGAGARGDLVRRRAPTTDRPPLAGVDRRRRSADAEAWPDPGVDGRCRRSWPRTSPSDPAPPPACSTSSPAGPTATSGTTGSSRTGSLVESRLGDARRRRAHADPDLRRRGEDRRRASSTPTPPSCRAGSRSPATWPSSWPSSPSPARPSTASCRPRSARSPTTDARRPAPEGNGPPASGARVGEAGVLGDKCARARRRYRTRPRLRRSGRPSARRAG